MRSKLLTLGRRHAEQAQQRAQQRAAGERERAAEWDRLVADGMLLRLLIAGYELCDNSVHAQPGVCLVPYARVDALLRELLAFERPPAVAGKRKGP